MGSDALLWGFRNPRFHRSQSYATRVLKSGTNRFSRVSTVGDWPSTLFHTASLVLWIPIPFFPTPLVRIIIQIGGYLYSCIALATDLTRYGNLYKINIIPSPCPSFAQLQPQHTDTLNLGQHNIPFLSSENLPQEFKFLNKISKNTNFPEQEIPNFLENNRQLNLEQGYQVSLPQLLYT